MRRLASSDILVVAGAVLCVGPEVLTSLQLGLPNDLAWWEWPIVLPISALMLGTPQLAMLAYVTNARSVLLRMVYVAASVAMLAFYYRYLTTIELSRSSTAAVGLYFMSIYMAVASAAVGGIILWLHRRLLRDH